MNKTLILHDGKYKRFIPRVEQSERKIDFSKELLDATFSASSYSDPTGYPASAAFDNNDKTSWLSGVTQGNPSWIMADLKEKRKITSYSLYCNANQQNINKWDFQGSDNNVDWFKLDSRQEVLTVGVKKKYNLDKVADYRYYRVYVTGYVGTTPSITRIRFETIELFETILPTPYRWEETSNFMQDGMDSLSPLLDRKVTTLDPLPMTNKSGILQQNEEGKVFGKTIDLKKYMNIERLEVKQ